jgi:N-acetylmuramoyl-L-alanine amidase
MYYKDNEWIVIHYVGAVSTAENNAKYFYKEKRGASAHYFVDENSIWQVVEDKDAAWHVGGAKKYLNGARNGNSIGIEMCCKKDSSGNWYIEPETIENTIWLTRQLMKKYNIPVSRVTTHYLTTGKICPEPFVRNPELWKNFLLEVGKVEKKFEIGQEHEALVYLTEQGVVTNIYYWEDALQYYKNLNHFIIKTANRIKELENEKMA